jgi:D-lactate dehydrogenase (cytochrome)
LRGELGGEAIDAMRAIKLALDPQNIFNPGKIIPASSG